MEGPLIQKKNDSQTLIPSVLQDWRFILLASRSKIAVEKGWDSANNYAFDDAKLLAHLSRGGGYGVLAGDNLIIDTDTDEFQKLIETFLPHTFSQRTPGHHTKQFFYRTNWNGDSRSIPIFDGVDSDGKPKNVGHVKGGASYVVGPGSIHPNGKLYEVCDDREIATVPIEDVLKAIAPYVAQKTHYAEKQESKKHGKLEFPISKLIELYKIAGLKEQSGELYGPHPIHGSNTGRNFWINPAKNEWFCFRCGTGGGPLQLLAVLSGVIDCREAQLGVLRGETFEKVLQQGQEKGLVPKITEDTQPYQMAALLLSEFSVKTFADTDEIYVYDSGVYKQASEGMVGKWVEHKFHEAALDDKATLNFIRETVGHVRRQTYVARDQFNSEPFVLNLLNGLLDTRTREFREHTPSYLSTTQLPISYSPTATCPNFLKFRGEVTYPEDQPMLQEKFGEVLYADYPTKKATLLVGDGDNGKSTLIHILKSLLGLSNVSARHLFELEANRFAKADLYGKLANLYADLPDSALKSVGIFKMLTGGDPITAEHKFKNSFTFINFAKLWFSCNKVPEVYEDTSAYFSRWDMLTFPNTFSGSKANRNLKRVLTTNEELSGVLNWALDGLTRLRENGWVFSNSRSAEQIRDEYIRKSSPIQAFVLDCTVQKSDAKRSKKELFDAFVEYCKEHQLPVVGQSTFFKRLPEFVKVETIHPVVNGKRVWCVAGIELKDKDQWGEKLVQTELGESNGGLDEKNPVRGVLPVPTTDVQDVQDVHPSGHLSDEAIDLEKSLAETISHLEKALPKLQYKEASDVEAYLTGVYGAALAKRLTHRIMPLLRQNPDGFLEVIHGGAKEST